jgi:glycosyltransferase involved in cell wall biosynthesis
VNKERLSIIVPVYNEESTVEQLLKSLLGVSLPLDVEVLVVDDASTDQTAQIIQQLMKVDERIRYFRHASNSGKGAAIHTATAHLTGTIVLIQDADLEYDPLDIPKLLQPILNGIADVVYGTRFGNGKPTGLVYWSHFAGNRFLTMWSNLFSGLALTDMETCYKLVRASIFQHLILKEKRFGFEPELTQKLARVSGIRIVEVPISYYGRSYKEGKKIKWKDGFWAVWCVVKYRFL